MKILQNLCVRENASFVRKRYEQMTQTQPEKFLPMIENFDQALSHPNVQDQQLLIQQLEKAL